MSTQVINNNEDHFINTSAPSLSQPTLKGMAAVYEALLNAFSRQQDLEKVDIEMVYQNLEHQKELAAALDQVNFQRVIDHEGAVNVRKEAFVDHWREVIQKNYGPETWKLIENYIRTGTMPPKNYSYLHPIMKKIRDDWNDHDFNGEANKMITDQNEEAIDFNRQQSKIRDSYNYQIGIVQQGAQLATSYCQSDTSRLNQTIGTFTASLSSQKEALDKIFR